MTNEINGIVVVDKAKDFTSHDCVNIVRKALGMKRVGHTGTLDPMATGILPICLGKATKIAELVSDGKKSYRAALKLGIKTDTYDITGEILSEKQPECTEDEIKDAILSFVGNQQQVPPMYSAKKVNGVKLYDLARKGVEIERKAADIEIYNIDILNVDIENYSAEIDVYCSKGTYIRSLIYDIGEKLGCGATMTELRRTGCGDFTLSHKDTVKLADIKEKGLSAFNGKIIPTDVFLGCYDEYTLNKDREKKFINGIPVLAFQYNNRIGEFVRIYNEKREFLALARVELDAKERTVLKSFKSFY